MWGNCRMTSIAAGAAITMGIATIARAQERELFHWSGRVDQAVQLTISGRNLTTTSLGPSEPGQRRTEVISPLPHTDGQVSVRVLDGRGTVDVIRQPTAENGYMAVIRIRDPQPGTGDYRLDAYWQPAAAGELGPPFNRSRANRVALQWSGEVDDNLLITLRPGGVSYRTVAGDEPRRIESSFNGIPAGATGVDVNLLEGRGQVNVIQQPTPDNGYTAVLRVRDPEQGYGHYTFDVVWR